MVLEKEQESEKLKLVRKDSGLYAEKGNCNSASCFIKKEIYAFKFRNVEEVPL